MIKHILVAYDGSQPAHKAFEFALDMAGKYGAALTVLAVSQPPEIPEEVETRAVIENSQRHYRQLLAGLRRDVPANVTNVRFELSVGHPAEQIINYAEQHKIDVIVTGHRGKTFLERWRLGSISQRIIQYAHCPVIVVR
jgi:nucleotide-binding universal stress UspA family protein